ncbi:MAG: endonuclease/exonuclease/phosphatase family protein [Myxococcales bacterium]
MSLRLLTWNIHGGVGSDRRFDLTRVGRVVASLQPDVAALQEVGEVHGRMPALDQARAVADQTGLRLAFMANVASGRRRYGNAVLSAFPIALETHYDLTVGQREPRGCLRADLELGEGARLHVFNLHLGLRARERRRQAMLLSADILRDAALSFPMVVVGDFNRWWPGPVRSLLRRALFDCAARAGRMEPTYPARWPLFRLDRVLAGAGLEVLDARAVDRGEARVASDHLPLLVRLEAPSPFVTGFGPWASGNCKAA